MNFSHNPKLIPLFFLIIGLSLLKYFTLLVYKKRNDVKVADNFTVGINSIYYILLSIIFIILVMSMLGVSLREFFTSISIIAAAIAIVTKDYIAQVVNGMILMFNNQFSIGDIVKIGQHQGRIVNISLLNLQIINDDDDMIFIPNTSVLSLDVVNYTKGNSYKVGVEFIEDTQRVNQIEDIENYILQNLQAVESLIIEDTVKIKVIDAKIDKLKIRVEAQLNTQNKLEEKRFKRHIINIWLKYNQQK
jgi:small-conductance mechanosensitive channel